MLVLSRQKKLTKKIVILDGLTGTGKTMFTPLLAKFEKMQNPRFLYIFESIILSALKGKIKPDASEAILNLLADQILYDNMISREVNFRPSDLSSVYTNKRFLEHIRQLFMRDGATVQKRIKTEKPVVFIVTHQIMSALPLLNKIFKQRLKMIQTVRHPVYLLDHWKSYIKMHGNNPRDFTLWIKNKKRELPWFAHGWESLYLKSNCEEKAIFSVCKLMKIIFKIEKSQINKNNILIVPFELFVKTPFYYLKKIESFLGQKMKKTIHQELKIQKLPRQNINQGPVKQIYERYHANKLRDEPENLLKVKIQKIKERVSSQAFNYLLETIHKYEKRFGDI